MAIFGSFSTVRAQLAHDSRFATAFAYLAEAQGHSGQTVDAVAKAISRFEA